MDVVVVSGGGGMNGVLGVTADAVDGLVLLSSIAVPSSSSNQMWPQCAGHSARWLPDGMVMACNAILGRD